MTQADIQSTICVSGYTQTVRPPESQTEEFKFSQAYPAYGLSAGARSELDHLVPLELTRAWFVQPELRLDLMELMMTPIPSAPAGARVTSAGS